MDIKTKLRIGNGVIPSLTVALAIVISISINTLVDTAGWVQHTHQVIGNAKNLEKLLVDMETGERGFLIAGKDEFLEPYIQGRAKFKIVMIETQQLVDDNPAQVMRLEDIEAQVHLWTNNAAIPEIAMREKMNKNLATINDVSALIESGTGKDILDGIRGKFAEFIRTEQSLLATRQGDAAKTADQAIFVIAVGSAFSVIFALAITVFFTRLITTREAILIREGELKTQSARVIDLMQGASNMQLMCDAVICELAHLTQSGHGVIYIKKEDEGRSSSLHYQGGFAINEREYTEQTTQLGEGLIGQCAIDQETLFITQVPDNYVQIKSSLGEAEAKSLLVVPILFEKRLMGVIELASLYEFSENSRELLRRVTDYIGITINMLNNLERIKAMPLLQRDSFE